MNFFCKLNKRTLKSFLVIHVVFSFIFLCTGTVISGHLPALAVYCIQRKKKSTDYPHWWITHTLCYSTFWWWKCDIKVIHFSLFIVVWFNFWKLESFFVKFKGQKKLRHMNNSVSILACTLLIKLYSKNTSGPCPNLNISYLTECEFVATFCVSDRSVPSWFVERKLGEC